MYVPQATLLLLNKPFVCFTHWLLALSLGLSWGMSMVLVPDTSVKGRRSWPLESDKSRLWRDPRSTCITAESPAVPSGL